MFILIWLCSFQNVTFKLTWGRNKCLEVRHHSRKDANNYVCVCVCKTFSFHLQNYKWRLLCNYAINGQFNLSSKAITISFKLNISSHFLFTCRFYFAAIFNKLVIFIKETFESEYCFCETIHEWKLIVSDWFSGKIKPFYLPYAMYIEYWQSRLLVMHEA